MRNLKKILALALALVMTLSLVTVANAFTDSSKVTAKYDEAVEVLNGLKVFEGRPDGSFDPQASITRAEVAAIIYRVATGDVTNAQKDIYKDYNKFDDVKSTDWFAGYVNYCANATYIKGRSATTFDPNGKVTGYEVLAMILRAVGYDVNGEFTGSGWQIKVASTAKELGITDTVVEGTLNTAATREVVAELLFRTIVLADQVTYTNALGYQSWGKTTLGVKTFGLAKTARIAIDDWGRPGYKWTATKPAAVKGTVATIKEAPVVTYTTAVTECQVAADYGFEKNLTLTTYVNGYVNDANTVMQATDTVGKIGAQGRLTEVYADRIVMIDTYLAQVITVTPAVYDAAGHLKTPATTTLVVYDGTNESATGGNVYTIAGNDFAKGDFILLNAVTDAWNSKTLDEGATDKYYETKGVAPSFIGAQSTIWRYSNQHIIDGTPYDDAYNYILDQAGSTAKVNFTWFKDLYGNVIGSAVIPTTYSYAVLTDLYWNTGRPGYATADLLYMDGTEAKDVVVNEIDGIANDATRIFGGSTYDPWTTFAPKATDASTTAPKFAGSYAYVSDEGRENGMYHGYALYKVSTRTDGSVDLLQTNFLHQNDAQVVNRGTEIYTGAGAKVYVDDATVFVIYNANNTYSRYVGKDNVPSITSTTDSLFYVDSNNDHVADYVYVNKGVVNGTGHALVAARSAQTGWNLFNNQAVFALRNAQVNGVDVAEGTVMAASANAGMITSMADSVNELYIVVYDNNGLVSAATNVTTTKARINGGADYVTKMIDASYTVGLGTLTTTSNNVGARSWNVNGVPVYGDYNTLAGVDFSKTNTYIVTDGTGAVAKAVYVYNIPEGAITPVTPTINSLTVTVNSGVSYGAYVRSMTFNATANNVSAGTFNGTVTATPVWQKLNTVTGNYEDFEGDAFVVGTYRAVVTLTVNNATGENYSIASNAPISYYSQANKTGASFITDPIVVTNP